MTTVVASELTDAPVRSGRWSWGSPRSLVTSVAFTAASLVLLVILWEAMSLWLDRDVLPGPWASIEAVGDAHADGFLWSDIRVTFERIMGAFVVSLVVSVVVGALLGSSTVLSRLFGPWVTIAASIPALVFIVVAYLSVGLNDRAAVVGTALVVAPTMAFNVWDGMKAINPELSEMSRAFGVSRWTTIRRVVLPQTVPFIFTAARAGLSLTWRIMIFVELLGRSSGVGYRIQYWYSLFNMERVIAAALPFLVLMLIIEFGVLRPAERYVFRWRSVESK